ncbi:MAG: hypothetical protein PHU25_20135 [Deltaproteobacteria bacterium]|nr:hypothetical protein [Deltaproteobacteria bacterium]
MRITSLFVVAAAAMLVGLAVAGCKDEESTPSCEEAMDNMYSQNCAMVVNDVQISKAEAINGCEDSANDVETCECQDEYDNMRECLAGLDACDDCATEFSKYNDCMGNC